VMRLSFFFKMSLKRSKRGANSISKEHLQLSDDGPAVEWILTSIADPEEIVAV
jgi:hypothetical protein